MNVFLQQFQFLLSSGAKVDFSTLYHINPLIGVMLNADTLSVNAIVNHGEVSLQTVQDIEHELRNFNPEHGRRYLIDFLNYLDNLKNLDDFAQICQNKRNSEQIYKIFCRNISSDKIKSEIKYFTSIISDFFNLDWCEVEKDNLIDLPRLVTLFQKKTKKIKEIRDNVEKYLVMLDNLRECKVEVDEMLKLLIPDNWLKGEEVGAFIYHNYIKPFSNDIISRISKYSQALEICKLHILTGDLWNDFKTVIAQKASVEQTIIGDTYI